MNAIVVYESLWGNTAVIARAIAEGIGEGTGALSTGEATAEKIAGADLIVAGSPILGFTLPTESMRASMGSNLPATVSQPDLSHPSMRSWLESLPSHNGTFATFETRVKGPWGNAVKAIAKGLTAAGLEPVASAAPSMAFIVTGKYGPLRDGELERARAWGSELARP